VAFAFFPTIARLLQIKLSNPDLVPVEKFNSFLMQPGKQIPELLVIVALGNGFILTAMLWGAFIAKLIDKQLKAASLFLVITASLTFFGIIHSAIPEGSMYFPWQLPPQLALVPYQFTAAYMLLALMFFVFSFSAKPVAEDGYV
jgi:AGZA family xanthine/uracil permease-like MFS transporter